MDPTEEELGQITQLQDALDWAGVEGDLEAALQQATGGIQRIREVTLITRQMWDGMAQGMMVPDEPDPNLPGPPNQRPLRPVMHGWNR